MRPVLTHAGFYTVLALLLATAASPVTPAAAQDDTQSILAQPSMSALARPGTRSVPVEPAPAPAAPQPRETAAARPEPTPEPAPAAAVVAETVPETLAAADPVPAPAATAQNAATGAQLRDILARAYADSPALRAEREVLRQQYENVARAEAGRRPVVTADGGVSWINEDTDPGNRENYAGTNIGVSATQFLYRGGRTLAEVERQLRLSDAALAAYDAVSQDVFLNVVTAAMDIQQARATIELTEQNRTVIERQLQMAQRGFDVGELTRTDVAQAQARLSGAEAQLVSARADYSSAIARFRQFAGQEGADLVIDIADASLPMPSSLETARAQGADQHPVIRVTREAEKAAQSAVRVAEGGLLPEIYALGTVGDARNPSSLVDRATTASLGLRASVPLYEGGATRAQIRQAKHGAYEQRDRMEDAARMVEQAITTAWNNNEAARAAIEAREKQVGAAQMARDGVYKEREVGTRTVLDTLDADAELLDARVALVRARRDAVVSNYALLAATGQLTAEKLGFFDTAAEKARLERTRGQWLGTAAERAK